MSNLEMFLNSLKLALMVIVYLVDVPKYYDAFEEKLTCTYNVCYPNTACTVAPILSEMLKVLWFHYIIFQTPYDIFECTVCTKIFGHINCA